MNRHEPSIAAPARPAVSPARLWPLWLFLAVLVPRLAVFPINENLYGDAIPRTEMAEQWALAPHVITSFGDGAAQFGPLHLYLVGGALGFVDREDAARLVSLVFGVLTVFPLFALTRRYFGPDAAKWACLGFAPWGLHIQSSTTGGSEAVALFLMLLAFSLFARALARRTLASFVGPALVMNLACATRYDAWMYVPLLSALPAFLWPSRRAGATAGAVFALVCLPFPLFWMYGNAVAHGDAFFPLTYIDAFHRTWAAESSVGWRAWWLRAHGIGFWPAMALFTLTPGIAALGAAGMASTWDRYPAARWLTIAALAPVVYYAVRISVFLNFVPLARFTELQLALLLPFVAPGFWWLRERYGLPSARRAAIASLTMAVLFPLGLGLYTFRQDGTAPTVLRPLSPTSTNARSLMDAAEFIKTEIVARGRTLALDSDATYQDLQVGFFARLTSGAAVRVRWPGFRERIALTPPDYVVRFDAGLLSTMPWIAVSGRALTMNGVPYAEVDGFAAPVHVYRQTPLTVQEGHRDGR